MKTRAAETAAKIADHTKLLLLNIKMRSERRKHCARAGCSKVRTPPARPLSQTHRQDRLQYTAPQLASAQCKNVWYNISFPAAFHWHFCYVSTFFAGSVVVNGIIFFFFHVRSMSPVTIKTAAYWSYLVIQDCFQTCMFKLWWYFMVNLVICLLHVVTLM